MLEKRLPKRSGGWPTSSIARRWDEVETTAVMARNSQRESSDHKAHQSPSESAPNWVRARSRPVTQPPGRSWLADRRRRRGSIVPTVVEPWTLTELARR
jgi:hypothetical protein